MPDTPKIKFRYNGEVYEMPWDGKADPSQADMQKFALENSKGRTVGERGASVWEELNTPLLPGIASSAKWLGDKTEKAIGGKTGKFTGELVDFTGDLAASFTSPFSLGTMGALGALGKGKALLKPTKVALKTAQETFDTMKVKGVTEMLPQLAEEVKIAKTAVAKSQAYTNVIRAAQGLFGTGALANAVAEAKEGRYGSATGNFLLSVLGFVGARSGKAEPIDLTKYVAEPRRLALPEGTIEPPKALGPGKPGPNIEIPSYARPPNPLEEINPATGFKSGTPADQQARFVVNELGQTADAARKYPIEHPGDTALWKDKIDPATFKILDPNPESLKYGFQTPTIGGTGEIANVPHDVAAAYGYSPTGGLGGKPEPGISSLFGSKPFYNNEQVTTAKTTAPLIRDGKVLRPEKTELSFDIENPRPPTIYGTGKEGLTSKPYEPSSTGPIEAATRGQDIFRPPEISSPYPKTTVFPRTKMREWNLTNPNFDFKSSFADWVNGRHAARMEATFRAHDFKALDQQFPDVASFAKAYQTNPRGNPLFTKLKSELDSDYSRAKGVFDDLWYKKNYLPQLWKEPKAVVNRVLGINDPNSSLNRRLGTRPFFTLDSFFKTYEEGINHRSKEYPNGLTPAFNKISDLLFYHKNMVEKGIADRTAFQGWAEAGILKPKNEIPRGQGEWKDLDTNHFPAKSVNGVHDIVYSAPKEVTNMINNYLRPSDESVGWLQKFGDINNYLKNIYLSSGVPKTAMNVHGYNITRRDWAARGVKGVPELATDFYRPEAKWKAMVEDPLTRAKMLKATRKGAMIQGIEEHQMSDSPTGSRVSQSLDKYKLGRGLNKALEFQKSTFEDPLFEGMLPAKKVRFIIERAEELMKKGMSEDQAYRTASDQGNIFYGGINTEAKGRNRTTQNILRSTLLAPDWLESNLRYAGKIAKSAVGKEDPLYAQSAARMGALRFPQLAAAAATGKAAFGERDSTALPIATMEDNREMQLPAWGTAFTVPQVAEQAIGGTLRGDFSAPGKAVYNRLAAVPKAGLNYMFNRDSMGNPMSGVGRFNQPISGWQGVLNTTANFIQPLVPPYVAALMNKAAGKTGTTESLLNAVESPFQFRYQPKKPKKKAQF